MPALCDWCGAVIHDGSERYSVVPDSSVIHPVDPEFDGWRMVVACGKPHLQQLHEDYEKRPFLDAEQWAGKIQRAKRGGDLADWELRVLTDLTDDQIRDAGDDHPCLVVRTRTVHIEPREAGAIVRLIGMSSPDAEIEAQSESAPTLVMLYGPPAVGKTTVGRALSDLTTFRFFHNHLTVTPARALFPGGQPPEAYGALLREWRKTGITAAARAGLGTVFTVAYSGDQDDDFVSEVVAVLHQHGGRTRFVELSAPEHILMSRVSNASRAALGKMTSAQELRDWLAAREPASVKHPRHTIRIDTSVHAPADAARRIAQAFRLTTGTCPTPDPN